MKFICVKITQAVLFFIFLSFQCKVIGQSLSPQKFPKIGDHFPLFLLNDLHYYTKSEGSSADFNGKPMIIDFFSEGCEACFTTLPHIDSIKREFKGRVQFLLVGKKSSGLIKQYQKYMKHYNINIPVDYDDSIIWNQFGVRLVPYTVWIDSNGVIRQITTPYALNSDRINNFLRGITQPLTISVNQSDDKNENYYNNFYDDAKPLLIGGNGGPDTSFLYRSILCKWDYRTYFHRDPYISAANRNRIQEVGVGLNLLFEFAYGDTVNSQMPRVIGDTMINHYGQWARFPLVESKRSSLFIFDHDSAKNAFSYSLILPDSNYTAKKLQQMMQNDLKNYFSFEVTIEKRKMPCWKIVAEKNAEELIRTKGGPPSWTGSFSEFSLRNQPINSLLVEIWGFHQYEPIFVDETGFKFNIDLDVNAVLGDLDDIKKALRKNGLDLVRGEREMNTIVIRDSE
jgi:thiol-disulfide isomerase/thioredoxin